MKRDLAELLQAARAQPAPAHDAATPTPRVPRPVPLSSAPPPARPASRIATTQSIPIWADQYDQLNLLRARLVREKSGPTERLTIGTVIRALLDIAGPVLDDVRGETEDEIRASLEALLRAH